MSLIIQDGSFGGSTNRVCTLTQYYLQRKMNIPFVTGTTTARASAGTAKTITVGAGHGVEIGDFLTVLGLGGTYYNCTQAFQILVVTATDATTITYTGSNTETEGTTPDTNGRWACSKWKTLRVGIRFTVGGDADFSSSNLYMGITTGTGKPVTGTSGTGAMGVRYGWGGSGAALYTWDAVNKRYTHSQYGLYSYYKLGATLSSLNFSADYYYATLPGDPAKAHCLFIRYNKSTATHQHAIVHENGAIASTYNNVTQAQFKSSLGYTANSALSPMYSSNSMSYTANVWEDPTNGIWDTFEICWGPGSNPLNILDLGWAIVER